MEVTCGVVYNTDSATLSIGLSTSLDTAGVSGDDTSPIPPGEGVSPKLIVLTTRQEREVSW